MVGGPGHPAVITLIVAPGHLAPGTIAPVPEEEAHHLRVRRGADAEPVRLVDGRGTLATGACLLGPALPLLLALQCLAGAAWGAGFLAGLSAAGGDGHVGREGLYVGLWFAGLAVAAMIRVGLGLAGIGFDPHLTPALAAGLWLAGALLLLPWLRTRQS